MTCAQYDQAYSIACVLLVVPIGWRWRANAYGRTVGSSHGYRFTTIRPRLFVQTFTCKITYHWLWYWLNFCAIWTLSDIVMLLLFWLHHVIRNNKLHSAVWYECCLPACVFACWFLCWLPSLVCCFFNPCAVVNPCQHRLCFALWQVVGNPASNTTNINCQQSSTNTQKTNNIKHQALRKSLRRRIVTP